MTRNRLAEFFMSLADAVRRGDSMEGRVRYTLSDRPGHDVDVDIMVREGNLQGQGSWTILNECASDPDNTV